MKRDPVRSSLIAAVGYDPQSAILELELRENKAGERKVYQYAPVPAELVDQLRASPSIGSVFGKLIRPSFAGKHVATVVGDVETPVPTEALT